MTAIFLKGLVSAVILVTADCWIAKGPAVVFARNERLPLVKCFQGALRRSRYIYVQSTGTTGRPVKDWRIGLTFRLRHVETSAIARGKLGSSAVDSGIGIRLAKLLR